MSAVWGLPSLSTLSSDFLASLTPAGAGSHLPAPPSTYLEPDCGRDVRGGPTISPTQGFGSSG